jgi:MurNAc alpha-1-phosphate uridylyltransferase
MILAAGRGERMRPLTDSAPKPLLKVGNKPLLHYHLEALAAAGIRDVVINLAWKGAAIRDALGDGSRFGISIQYSDEGDEALETGGGVFNALPLLGEAPFLVVSGDVWSDYSMQLAQSRLSEKDLAHFVLAPNPPYHPHGDFALQGDRVTEAGERYTYANIGVFSPRFFAGCRSGRFALAPLMYERIRAGQVSGELYRGRWFNIGTPQQLKELDLLLSQCDSY